jgi:hypothetical protein
MLLYHFLISTSTFVCYTEQMPQRCVDTITAVSPKASPFAADPPLAATAAGGSVPLAQQLMQVPTRPLPLPPSLAPPPPHPQNQRRPTRRSRRRRPLARLLVGLPMRREPPLSRPHRPLPDRLRGRLGLPNGMGARGATRQEPGRGGGVRPQVDADGYQEVVSRSTRRRLGRDASVAAAVPPRRSRIPPEFEGKCLNCLSTGHRVATCKLPRRCVRCHGFRHLARDCKRPRSPPVEGAAPVDAAPRRFVRATVGVRRRLLWRGVAHLRRRHTTRAETGLRGVGDRAMLQWFLLLSWPEMNSHLCARRAVSATFSVARRLWRRRRG